MIEPSEAFGNNHLNTACTACPVYCQGSKVFTCHTFSLWQLNFLIYLSVYLSPTSVAVLFITCIILIACKFKIISFHIRCAFAHIVHSCGCISMNDVAVINTCMLVKCQSLIWCAGTSELPLLDYPLRRLFHLLGVQSVLDIFTGMLLEQQILFYSCGQCPVLWHTVDCRSLRCCMLPTVIIGLNIIICMRYTQFLCGTLGCKRDTYCVCNKFFFENFFMTRDGRVN